MTYEPLSIEKLLADVRRLRAELGPPPPEVRISRYATALPSAKPYTYDMKEMVERLGQQRVPAAFRIRGAALGLGADIIVMHPDLLERKL